MERLFELLEQMEENSKLINNTRNKKSREALIFEDNLVRHKVLSEVCRLYRNGTFKEMENQNKTFKNTIIWVKEQYDMDFTEE